MGGDRGTLTANFAEDFDQDHGVIIEVLTSLLSQRDLSKDHHEGLIEHLLLQEAVHNRPLELRLVVCLCVSHEA